MKCLPWPRETRAQPLAFWALQAGFLPGLSSLASPGISHLREQLRVGADNCSVNGQGGQLDGAAVKLRAGENVCVPVSLTVYEGMCEHVGVSMCDSVCVSVSARANECVCVCMCVPGSICMSVGVDESMCVYTRECVCVCGYEYVCGWLLYCLCLENVFAFLGCSAHWWCNRGIGPGLFRIVAFPRPFHLCPQGVLRVVLASDPG